jgi:hypothetical protein
MSREWVGWTLVPNVGHKHITCKERDKYNIDVQGMGWLNPCPTYLLDIYIILISLFTGDVFVTYVRDKGSTNPFPGHLYNIYLSLYS